MKKLLSDPRVAAFLAAVVTAAAALLLELLGAPP